MWAVLDWSGLDWGGFSRTRVDWGGLEFAISNVEVFDRLGRAEGDYTGLVYIVICDWARLG